MNETSGRRPKPARFADKVVVVTGGGSGIGLQIARDLYAEGTSVHILGRNSEKLEKAKASIAPAGSRFYCHHCDISDHQWIRSVFGSIKETWGRISGLVNNAAITPSRNDMFHTDHRDWLEALDVNLIGAFNRSQAAAAQMPEAGKGSIVNIASGEGSIPSGLEPPIMRASSVS